jgi:hypothetical protein
MPSDGLKQLLGDQAKQQDYADFLRRFQQDPGSISEAEASRRYRELVGSAGPNAVAEAYQHVLGQLAPEQRQQLAQQYQNAHDDPRSGFNGFRFADSSQAADARHLGQMAQQAAQQDPDLFDRIFGKDSPLSGPLGRLALAAIAAYLANRALSQQPGQQSGQPGATQNPGLPGGLIGALGGLIGALSQGQSSGQGSGLPGGLGGLIGALSQGQSSGQNPSLPGGLGGLLDALSQGQQSGQGSGLPSGLSDLLDALSNPQRPAGSSAGTNQPPADTGDGGAGLHVKGSQTKKQI